MYPVLAVILLALAGFSVLAFRLSGPASPGGVRSAGEMRLQGFLYVGAAAVAALSVAVVVVGLVDDRSGRAESLAMFGLFTYACYLAGTVLLHRLTGRRRGR